MKAIRTIVGVDTAKRVFQLHWVELETGNLAARHGRYSTRRSCDGGMRGGDGERTSAPLTVR